MTKTSWQFHWRRLFLEDFIYVLGFMALSLLIDLLNRLLGINFHFFDANQVCSTSVVVFWIELMLLTKENTTFLLQTGISRWRNWSLQWLSTLLSSILLGVLFTIYLAISASGPTQIHAFAKIFKSYQPVFNQTWQFNIFLLVMLIFLIIFTLLLGFIIGLLITRMNRVIAFLIVYGSFITLPGLIAGGIGLIYWQSNRTVKAKISEFLWRLIGHSQQGVEVWPLIITLIVVMIILSWVSYLVARRLQVKIRKG